MIHPTTWKIISKYKELTNDPEMSEVWRTAFGKKFGGLAQGDKKTGEKGSNSVFVLDHEGIKNIPKDRKFTYGRLVVDYREQKEDPTRVRLTASGNLISYPGKTTTKNCGSHDIKSAMEQHLEHSTGKIHVH